MPCMLRFRVRGSNSSKGMRPWTRGLAQRRSRGRSAPGAGYPSTIALAARGGPWRCWRSRQAGAHAERARSRRMPSRSTAL